LATASVNNLNVQIPVLVAALRSAEMHFDATLSKKLKERE
jgi:hypothetical protein